MKAELIIKEINDLLDKRTFSTSDKLEDDYPRVSFGMKTNYTFELSNIDLNNQYCFKIDSIDDIGKIWTAVTKIKHPDINQMLRGAIRQFNIDSNKDIFIIVKIQ